MKLFIKISDFKPFKTISKYLTKGAVEAGVKGLQLHVFADQVQKFMKVSILIFTICPPRIELLPPPLTYNVDKINSMREVIMTYLPSFDDSLFKFAPAWHIQP